MTRGYVIIALLAAVLVGAFIVVWSYPRFKMIEKRNHTPESVASILPEDVDSAAALIDNLFNAWAEFNQAEHSGSFQNKFPKDTQWSKFFLFQKETGPQSLFPTDEELLHDHGVDTSIERYVRIPSEQRAHDVYLYEPTGDYYWESEYLYNGQPARFRCSFIVHVETVDPASTKVEVFEYQPTIWVGQYLGLSAHAIFPTMLSDIRPVEATVKDRKDVLTMIQKALAPQSPVATQ